jgi:maleylacetoacetate isomerase
MPYKLFSYFRSSASYRVRIALNLKGLSYDIESKHLRRLDHRTAEFLNVNPQGLLPVLEHDGQYFAQSIAIIEYLDEIQPNPALLPTSPAARAIVRSMALHIACEMHPLGNLRVLQYLKQELEHDEDTINRWYCHWIAEGFRGLEQMVARQSGGPYCYGDRISLADVCLVPQIHNARRFGCDLNPYPLLSRIAEHLQREPAFVAAQPDKQPDAD